MPTGRLVTDDGMAVPAVSAETTREVDRIAIGEQAPNLFQMMENAGRSLALTAIDHLGPTGVTFRSRFWPGAAATEAAGSVLPGTSPTTAVI